MTAAASMTGQPSTAFRLTINPVRIALPAGAHHLHQRIEVTNSGTGPLHLTATIMQVTKGSTCHAGGGPATSWAHVSPASFTLKPGQSEHARFTINAPASASGTADVAAVFTATTPGHAGTAGAKLAGSVGSQALITLSGHKAAVASCVGLTAPKATPPAAPKVSTTAGLLTFGAVVLVAATLVAVGVHYLRRWRRNHKRGAPMHG
jgi:hypothetical protein